MNGGRAMKYSVLSIRTGRASAVVKRASALLAVLVLLICLSASGFADGTEGDTLPYYVSDVANLLTDAQRQTLEDSARAVSERYSCGVYVVTLPDYREYTQSRDVFAFAQEFYRTYNLGIGSNRTGILLLLSMDERDYALAAYGSFAHEAFTDYGKEKLSDRFLQYFRRNDWNGGFTAYVSGCEQLLSAAAAGNPVDVSYETGEGLSPGAKTAVVFGVPLLSALSVCEVMKRKMKPVKLQSRADEYIVPGGIDLSLKRDVFVNRTVSRTVIRHEERSSGHGGTTVHSSGFSGHSGKF